MGTFGRIAPAVAVVVSTFALAGCQGTGGGGWFGSSSQPDPAVSQPAQAPEIPATIRSSEIVGRWGYAAFHRAEDRPRTETAARGQCRQAGRHQPRSGRRRHDVSRRSIRTAGAAAQGRAQQPQLHRSGRRARGRSAGSRDRAASTAASCCCVSPIRKSTAVTAPASMCAARRPPVAWRRPKRKNDGHDLAQRKMRDLAQGAGCHPQEGHRAAHRRLREIAAECGRDQGGAERDGHQAARPPA